MQRKRIVTTLALTLLFGGLGALQADADRTWEAKGVMTDACQCTTFCPCEFGSKPTFGHCDDAAILHIDEGHFGRMDLAGTWIVVVSASPDGERLVDTVGNLVFARFYVPKDLPKAKADALVDLARRVFGTVVDGATRISADEKVYQVDMEIERHATRHKARIPGVLDLDIEALPGADAAQPMKITNHTFNEYGMTDPIVAQSHVYRYTDDGKDWNYGGRSASIREFAVGGEI